MLITGINAILLVGCAILTTRIATDVYRMLGEPAVTGVPVHTAHPTARSVPTWSEREAIIARDLFHDPDLMPTESPPAPPAEEVEETELPLALLGTISSSDAELAMASVWDAHASESVLVGQGDELVAGKAVVVDVERGRLLLAEHGATRELLLDANPEIRPPRRPVARPPKRPSQNRRQRRSRRR